MRSAPNSPSRRACPARPGPALLLAGAVVGAGLLAAPAPAQETAPPPPAESAAPMGQDPAGLASGRDGNLMAAIALMPMTGGAFQTLWNTPRETAPQLPVTGALHVGQTATLALLVGGMRRAGGWVDVLCRIELVAPDDSRQTVIDGPCLSDLPASAPTSDLYAAQVVDFQPPPSFEGADLTFEARVIDRHTGAQVDLRLAAPVQPPEAENAMENATEADTEAETGE